MGSNSRSDYWELDKVSQRVLFLSSCHMEFYQRNNGSIDWVPFYCIHNSDSWDVSSCPSNFRALNLMIKVHIWTVHSNFYVLNIWMRCSKNFLEKLETHPLSGKYVALFLNITHSFPILTPIQQSATYSLPHRRFPPALITEQPSFTPSYPEQSHWFLQVISSCRQTTQKRPPS